MLLYSWRFSRYSAPIHWLVHGHMTSNNESVSRKMPWAANIAKTMTSKGNSSQLPAKCLPLLHVIRACSCCRRNFRAFFKICFYFVSLHNKSQRWDSRETKFTVTLLREKSLSVYCFVWRKNEKLGHPCWPQFLTYCTVFLFFSKREQAYVTTKPTG